MKLFISYSHTDRFLVDKMVAILRSGGQEPWIDDELRVGSNWREQLRISIASCDGIVLAITPAWISSEYCQWEFTTAVDLGKFVIPIILEKTEIPARISDYQYVDFSENIEDSMKTQKLLNDILELKKDKMMSDSSSEQTNRISQTGKTNVYIENSSGTINIGG